MDKRQRSSIGLPQETMKILGPKPLFKTGISGTKTGTETKFTLDRNQALDNARRGLGMKEKKLPTMTDTSMIKSSMGITENAIHKIEKIILEQLLEESKSFLEERDNTMKIGSAPDNTMNRYQEPRTRYTVNDLNRNMRKKIEMDEEQTRAAQKQAAKIEPGTEMTARENVIGITQGATNKYSAGRLLGAQNRARYLDMKEKEMQQELGNTDNIPGVE